MPRRARKILKSFKSSLAFWRIFFAIFWPEIHAINWYLEDHWFEYHTNQFLKVYRRNSNPPVSQLRPVNPGVHSFHVCSYIVRHFCMDLRFGIHWYLPQRKKNCKVKIIMHLRTAQEERGTGRYIFAQSHISTHSWLPGILEKGVCLTINTFRRRCKHTIE